MSRADAPHDHVTTGQWSPDASAPKSVHKTDVGDDGPVDVEVADHAASGWDSTIQADSASRSLGQAGFAVDVREQVRSGPGRADPVPAGLGSVAVGRPSAAFGEMSLEPVRSTDDVPNLPAADDLAEWHVEADSDIVRAEGTGAGVASTEEPFAGRSEQVAVALSSERGRRVVSIDPSVQPPSRLHLLYAAGAGLGVVGFVGQWWAVPIGFAVAVGVRRFLRKQEPAEIREARKRAVAELPLGADLLAAALRAGAPVDRAVSAVAEALGGPLGERLERVARSLRLGAEPDEAWAHLSDVAGGARLISAAIRSSSSGGALAGAFTRLADDLRADRTVAVEAAARRAGVLIVLPLGLCFLPAFVLAGLVPVMVAVVGDVL